MTAAKSLIPAWRDRLLAAFWSWALRTKPPQTSPIVLIERRIFVLPTRAGIAYAAMLLVLLLGAINYNLSLGHAIVFLLAGLGVMTILATFRNLLGLEIEALPPNPVFAGQEARFALLLRNDRMLERHRLLLRLSKGQAVWADLPAQSVQAVSLSVPAEQRGWLPLPPVTIETRWPLGLIRAFSICVPDVRCLVWPRPAVEVSPLPHGLATAGGLCPQGLGGEDFAGLRPHQPADPPQHVAWKAAARMGEEATLLTKLFAETRGETVMLDWQTLPAHLGVEERLSWLTRWVLEAHQQARPWGLRLPGRTWPIAQGEAHLARCLEALALFEA